MANQVDPKYYAWRATVEGERARTASNATARSIHDQLARHYRELAREVARAERAELAVPSQPGSVVR